jgi:hypothetical protein
MMKRWAIYSGVLVIIFFFLAVGLVSSTDEDQRCDDWLGGCDLFEPEITPQSNESRISPPSKVRIVVLANSIDFELATDFFAFLGNKGIETVHSTASYFNQYKEEKFIVILGGPDAPEGVGSIVQEALSEVEENSVREAGARKKYIKTNIWDLGQRVMVIAGSNRRSHPHSKTLKRRSNILNRF